MEEVTERRSQRQLEREREDQNMKMTRECLIIALASALIFSCKKMSSKIQRLNSASSETRECDMEATPELQLEKLHSTPQRVDSKSSEEDPVHWNV
uniref:Uncharacterized protein n=1 Tax=Magallana gigas TaxID=29159 RepID=A0A8W8M529_MAGGI